MALKLAFTLFDAFLGVSGVVLGGVQIYMQEWVVKGYVQQIKKLVDKNKDLLDSSTDFSAKMNLITSPIFHVQLNTTSIALASNVQQIQLYYQTLAQVMKHVDLTKYHEIMSVLSGSNPLLLKVMTYGLFGINVLFAVFSTWHAAKAYQEYKALKRQKGDHSVNQTSAQKFAKSLQNPHSEGRLMIQKSFQTPMVLVETTPQAKFSIESSFIELKSVSSDKSFGTKLTEMQSNLHKNTTPLFEKILTGVSIVVNAASVGMSIYSIIQTTKSIDSIKEKLEDTKRLLSQFLGACLDVLYNIRSFMAAFQAQLYSYISFLSYTKLICIHNSLNFSNIDNPNKQSYTTQILLLELPEVDKQSFSHIQDARKQLQTHLSDIKITQHTQMVKGKQKKTYSSNQAPEVISTAFKNVTTAISKLDSQIDIAKIYNSIYAKLQNAEIILTRVNLQNGNKTLQFLSQVKKFYALPANQFTNPLGLIFGAYLALNPTANTDPTKMTEVDKLNIARAISLFTNHFPVDTDKTNVLGYELSSFQMTLPNIDALKMDTGIEDIDISQMMPSWSQNTKPQSQKQLAKYFGQENAKLYEYKGSSVYCQNKGTVSKPQQQMFRVQFFQKGQTKAYVLYNYVTNIFEEVRDGHIKKLPQNAA